MRNARIVVVIMSDTHDLDVGYCLMAAKTSDTHFGIKIKKYLVHYCRGLKSSNLRALMI